MPEEKRKKKSERKMKLLLLPTQFKASSEIFAQIGQVFFASVVVTPLATQVDRIDWPMIGLGTILSLISWAISVWISKKGSL